MALTDQEKLDIIFQLGWPGETLTVDSTSYSKIISDRVTDLSAPIELRVRGLLARVAKVDVALESAVCRLSAKEVGDIVLRDDELYQLRREKKRLLRELSDLLDIPIMRQGDGGGISVCV